MNLRLHLIDLSRRLEQDSTDDVADYVLYRLQQVARHLSRIAASATGNVFEIGSLCLLLYVLFYSLPVCSPHGTAMGTKMAVAFSNIFMNKVETGILSQSLLKPLVWKRYIDDIFSLWTTNRDRIEHFIEQANNHHPTIKFTAEISDKETTFLDTYIYKGERFERDAKPLLKL